MLNKYDSQFFQEFGCKKSMCVPIGTHSLRSFSWGWGNFGQVDMPDLYIRHSIPIKFVFAKC